MRIRLTFSKKEIIRFTGHLDLHHTLERTFRRARLPVVIQGVGGRDKVDAPTAGWENAKAIAVPSIGAVHAPEEQVAQERIADLGLGRAGPDDGDRGGSEEVVEIGWHGQSWLKLDPNMRIPFRFRAP